MLGACDGGQGLAETWGAGEGPWRERRLRQACSRHLRVWRVEGAAPGGPEAAREQLRAVPQGSVNAAFARKRAAVCFLCVASVWCDFIHLLNLRGRQLLSSLFSV